MEEEKSFEMKLASLLNRGCEENKSDTPDFILAEYMYSCLCVFNRAVNLREKWYGREPKPYIGEIEVPEEG